MRIPNRRIVTSVVVAVFVGLFVAPRPAATHDIPVNVTVRTFVKPEGNRLRLLVRVPLESMRDHAFPVYGPGFLQLDSVQPVLLSSTRQWIADYVEVYENGERLFGEEIVATRVSLPSDRSFATYDEALAHVLGAPLDPSTELPWQQALLDVLIDYPIQSETSRFSIRTALAHLGMTTTTVLHFVQPDGPERVMQYTGDPGIVDLDPGWFQAARGFVALGFEHILDGIDHILFVLLLVIPVRRLRPLVAVITSFTVAHSVTLIASALGMAPTALWFPPLIETLIALSIVFMALENVIGANLNRRWLIAFGFGLVHGFGFSFILRESLQFAGSHLLMSLVAFNVGVELGQILIVLAAIPVLSLLFKRVVDERTGTIIFSVIIAHTAWHWMADRYATFSQYPIEIPAMTPAMLAIWMRWAMAALILALAVWSLSGWFGKLVRDEGSAPRVKPAAKRGEGDVLVGSGAGGAGYGDG